MRRYARVVEKCSWALATLALLVAAFVAEPGEKPSGGWLLVIAVESIVVATAVRGWWIDGPGGRAGPLSVALAVLLSPASGRAMGYSDGCREPLSAERREPAAVQASVAGASDRCSSGPSVVTGVDVGLARIDQRTVLCRNIFALQRLAGSHELAQLRLEDGLRVVRQVQEPQFPDQVRPPGGDVRPSLGLVSKPAEERGSRSEGSCEREKPPKHLILGRKARRQCDCRAAAEPERDEPSPEVRSLEPVRLVAVVGLVQLGIHPSPVRLAPVGGWVHSRTVAELAPDAGVGPR